jgi:hypothetical protein
MSCACLIDGDAVIQDNDVETKEGGDLTKSVNGSVFLKRSDDNVSVGHDSITNTEKIIGGMAL